jgi:hypothetical protein
LSLRSDDFDSVGELYTEHDFRQLVVAFYDYPAEHLKHLRTTDEMDKRFYVRRGIFSCAGDLVAKRGVTAGSAAGCLIPALPD